MAKANKASEPEKNAKVNKRLRPARPFDWHVRPENHLKHYLVKF
jgi:hypothetical protein